MSYKVGIAGLVNTGKSFSRSFIKDGENVFLIAPSLKATYLKNSEGKPLRPFDVATAKYENLASVVKALGAPNKESIVAKWNKDLPPGTFTKENLKGNMVLIEQLSNMPVYLEFISKHLPWIHTVIMPDFTHHISREISSESFIARKAGGEAYQKFWELAGSALRNFILSLDNYREDLLIVTEYHADYDEPSQSYDIYIPAGKMLKEKFKIPSYYDFLFFTDVKSINEGEDNESAEYRFVTKPTKKYPQARAMAIFETTYISNDLSIVLAKVREHLDLKL